ncbi:dynamin [Phlyctema vagabunda]|uniref:Dynamin n=1 Tax=Phlyctema vagabunda TaxID=108571 RepID=A0ABR4P4I6_9HELO
MGCARGFQQIILRHKPGVSRITARVIPHSSRDEAVKTSMRAYHRELKNFEQLPEVIQEVTKLMQIRPGVSEGPAFAADVLRIEYEGNTGLHLTVVDLPGLISVANDEQTDEDVALVSNLVDNYLESSRTIILAVVQASNDIANQAIIQRARKFDKAGQRTVGIITKPDLINRGTEARIALLAKNEDTTKLKLGFFLLKNPNPVQLNAGISQDARKKDELDFFATSPWREYGLDKTRLGVDALREFLQELLEIHIEKELPKVRKEIQALLARKERDMANMGDERSTVAHIRMFLTRLSMKFHSLAQAALDGNYHSTDSDFFVSNDDSAHARLRAELHKLNGNFSTYMRVNGQKRKIRAQSEPDSDASSDEEPNAEEDQVLVTKKEWNEWVKEVYYRTRGRELPGNYNHVLLSELYHEQSSRWPKIAEDHLESVFSTTVNFIDIVFDSVITEAIVRDSVREIVLEKLEFNKQGAAEELKRLVEDEKRQPITYNHYYTDTIQNARKDSAKIAIQKAMDRVVQYDLHGKLHVSNTPVDTGKFLASLQNRVLVDMDDQACSEAKAGMEAYYKACIPHSHYGIRVMLTWNVL